MAHTTSIYYRDRLGFEPDYESPHRQYGSGERGRATMEQHGSSSVQRHVSSSHSSSSHAVHASSTSSTMMSSRHVTSSSGGGATSVMHHKSATNGSAYYESNGHGGHGGHHANGGDHGGAVTTVSRMDTHRSGGHYEENLQQFKGSSKKCSGSESVAGSLKKLALGCMTAFPAT